MKRNWVQELKRIDDQEWTSSPTGFFIFRLQQWTTCGLRKHRVMYLPTLLSSSQSSSFWAKHCIHPTYQNRPPPPSSFSAEDWLPMSLRNKKNFHKYPPLCFQVITSSCYSVWIIHTPTKRDLLNPHPTLIYYSVYLYPVTIRLFERIAYIKCCLVEM